MKSIFISFIFILSIFKIHAQSSYNYSVDLTKVNNDELVVNLICPSISTKQINFYLPRIVPGTYMNSNYGKYVYGLMATDKNGKVLPTKKTDDNTWQIYNANKLYKISYSVEDTWFSKIDNKVYSMCGTNFEAGKNFVLNTPGIFGYFEGMKNIPFHLSFTKPAGFYGASALTPTLTSNTKDEFLCNNADHLYDSPIMYSLPDTTTIKVGNTEVLVAVYSPNKLAHSKFLADSLKRFLYGAKDYLAGKLPVNKYAFLFYLNGEQPKLETSGAWEHSYSSFYSLEEQPENEGISFWVDIAAHEFFHIVTPLTISSKEVKEFNYNKTVLSKHLWLYEGSTEYYSQNMQAWAGIKTPEQFLENLSEKIRFSKLYMNDSLSFTELSTQSAGKHKDQYGNVYMKGAMINASLDLYLLKLSNGQYGLRNLKHDLGIRYGKDAYFEDDSLFHYISDITYPEIGEFFKKYVSSGQSIPYEQFFSYAGVKYLPVEKYMDFTLGGLDLKPTENNQVGIGIKNMNDFGKTMGFGEGDILYSVNSMLVNTENVFKIIDKMFNGLKVGDILNVQVIRKGTSGMYDTVKLSSPSMKIEKQRNYVLRFDPNPDASQLKIRNVWLNNHSPAPNVLIADTADVSSIDGIIKATYDVISGEAGPRNWNRFNSLFHKDAFMGAIVDHKVFRKFSPAQYAAANAPYFLKNAFIEKELKRTVNEYRNIAQVFSFYEYTTTENGKMVSQRGTNSIELIKENGRWYIMSISWDEE